VNSRPHPYTAILVPSRSAAGPITTWRRDDVNRFRGVVVWLRNRRAEQRPQRNAPMTRQNVNALLKQLGEMAGIDGPVRPHSLRHATGFKLANEGVDTRSLAHYLGHANIANTARYTELASGRFNGWWRD
jgi:integrase